LTLPEQKLICTRPFEWCEIHPGGDLFLCCPTWLKRPIGNILKQDIEQIWNSSVAREIRKSIFNHSFHNCHLKRCPFLSTTHAPVGTVETVMDQTVAQALINKCDRLSYLPKRLNLCFDHSCNLACPSCRPNKRQAVGTERECCRNIADRLIDQLFPQAEEITLSGFGDPFASPIYFSLLKRLNQYSGATALRLHTNGLLWTEKTWETLPNLHTCVREAEISIDAATAGTYAINRPGGSFSELLNNLDYLARQPFPLTFSMVVQSNNYHEIPAFVALAEQYDASVYFSQLINWGTFNRSEYSARAIHLADHPQHDQFRSLFNSVACLPRIKPGNLHPPACVKA